MNRPVLVALVVLVASCPAEDPSDAGSNQCTCPAETAAQTSYDNTSSMLGAMNVQDAVDELAARPLAEAPIGTRLKENLQETPNPGTEIVSAIASCDDSEHDRALGGNCGPQGALGAALLGGGIVGGGYQCMWRQPLGNTDMLRVSVLCLTAAR